MLTRGAGYLTWQVGAILGSTILTLIYDSNADKDVAMQTILYICALCGLGGAFCTVYGLSDLPSPAAGANELPIQVHDRPISPLISRDPPFYDLRCLVHTGDAAH